MAVYKYDDNGTTTYSDRGRFNAGATKLPGAPTQEQMNPVVKPRTLSSIRAGMQAGVDPNPLGTNRDLLNRFEQDKRSRLLARSAPNVTSGYERDLARRNAMVGVDTVHGSAGHTGPKFGGTTHPWAGSGKSAGLALNEVGALDRRYALEDAARNSAVDRNNTLMEAGRLADEKLGADKYGQNLKTVTDAVLADANNANTLERQKLVNKGYYDVAQLNREPTMINARANEQNANTLEALRKSQVDQQQYAMDSADTAASHRRSWLTATRRWLRTCSRTPRSCAASPPIGTRKPSHSSPKARSLVRSSRTLRRLLPWADVRTPA